MADGNDCVAIALNRLTDMEFTEALNADDQGALSELLLEYFCSTPDEKEDIGMS